MNNLLLQNSEIIYHAAIYQIYYGFHAIEYTMKIVLIDKANNHKE